MWTNVIDDIQWEVTIGNNFDATINLADHPRLCPDNSWRVSASCPDRMLDHLPGQQAPIIPEGPRPPVLSLWRPRDPGLSCVIGRQVVDPPSGGKNQHKNMVGDMGVCSCYHMDLSSMEFLSAAGLNINTLNKAFKTLLHLYQISKNKQHYVFPILHKDDIFDIDT